MLSNIKGVLIQSKKLVLLVFQSDSIDFAIKLAEDLASQMRISSRKLNGSYFARFLFISKINSFTVIQLA
jgi:hypothetical protein